VRVNFAPDAWQDLLVGRQWASAFGARGATARRQRLALAMSGTDR
jgi:hypothetical protein